ncbi:MAG: hypothetical protein H3C47_02415 [Candidatus Cloacimonetes bacterium]|nr:hypothetical protein [Candidatus Cloacimonadota bacterium]
MKQFGIVSGRLQAPCFRNWPVLGNVTLLEGYWVFCFDLPRGFNWQSYRNPRTFLGCFLAEIQGIECLIAPESAKKAVHFNLLSQDCSPMFPIKFPGLYYALRREFKLQKSLLKSQQPQDSES